MSKRIKKSLSQIPQICTEKKQSVKVRDFCEQYKKTNNDGTKRHNIQDSRGYFSVHKELGPGLLESVYEAALAFELIDMGLDVRTQVGLPVQYKLVNLDLGFRLDILVNNQVIIEIKSVEMLHDVHKKQLLTYLKLSNKKLGILVNFNVASLIDKESIVRIIN